MIKLQEIVLSLSKHLSPQSMETFPDITIHHVEYLKQASLLTDNTLYICHPSEKRLFDVIDSPKHFAVFVSMPNCTDLTVQDSRIIPVFLDARQLHARISCILNDTGTNKQLQLLFQLAHSGNWSIDLLTHALGEMLDIGIFLLNADNQLLSGYLPTNMEDCYASQLLKSGMLSAEQSHDISTGMECEESRNIRRIITHVNLQNGAPVTLFFLSRNTITCSLDDLSEGILNHLSALLRLHPDAPLAIGIDRNPLIAILNGSVSSESQLRRILGQTQESCLYQIMVADLDSGNDYYPLQRCFSAVFSDVQTAIYAGKLYAVIRFPDSKKLVRTSWMEKGLQTNWDYTRFEQTLLRLKAHACYSAAFHSPTLICNIATLCTGALNIARQLNIDSEKIRLHSEDEYLLYLIYDQAFPPFLHNNDLTSIKCFFYPDICALIKYDLQHNTDMCFLLYTYLSSNLNANKTADILYVHRNTVYNKLKVIQEILKTDFQDTQLFSFYLDSLKLYMYFKHYLGLDMRKMLL